jgi:hypothetical protein
MLDAVGSPCWGTYAELLLRLREQPARFLSQLHLLNFAGTSHGELVNEEDVARDLVARDLAATMIGHVLFCQSLAGIKPNERHGDLA